ncbi:hypothetical protein DXG01_004236 [Tephrocybe rancida]|nr:hypothetical protein DXG01_004236 [Tephrocybe rancida]
MRLPNVEGPIDYHSSAAPADRASFPLPLEIIEGILIRCRTQDVISFSNTCRLARSVIFDASNNDFLWREIFLSNFDDPRCAPRVTADTATSVDWKHQALERMNAELVAQSPNSSFPSSRAAKLFISAIHEVPSEIQDQPRTTSLNLEWLRRILPTSGILNVDEEIPHSERIISAQLRAYISLDHDQGKEETSLRLFERRKRSRLYVYNIRNYSGRHWGPFLDDDRVDWIHVEHLVNVLVMNFRHLPDDWPRISPPCGLDATRRYSAPTNGLDDHRDWARVAGTWRRYVSYMDFRDLYAFNFDFNRQIDPTFFDCPRFRECTRLLELKLRLIDAGSSRYRHHLGLWPNVCMRNINTKYPPIYFEGTSTNYRGNRAVVEGVVHMAPDGTVRWQFSTTHPETARWCSDGAQIGNTASASGVVGIWTTEFRQKDDPVGKLPLLVVSENWDPLPRITIKGLFGFGRSLTIILYNSWNIPDSLGGFR